MTTPNYIDNGIPHLSRNTNFSKRKKTQPIGVDNKKSHLFKTFNQIQHR